MRRRGIDILVGSQVFSWQRVGGISRYAVRLAEALARRDEVHVTLCTGVHRNEYARQITERRLRCAGWAQSPRGKFPGRIRFNALLDQWLVWTLKPDMYHASFYAPLPRLPRRTKLVATVYDCLHEIMPGEEDPTGHHAAWKKPVIEQADHLIAISETTRQAVMDIYHVPGEKITAVHLGVDRVNTEKHRAIQGDYILFVGNRARHKGVATLYEAFARVAPDFADVKLFLAGSNPISENERVEFRRLGIEGRVSHLQVDEPQLAAAYRDALATVVPSVYEGFGLPVVESMAHGTPLICSNGGSLPEVAGDAALVFPVGDAEALANCLRLVLNSPAERERLAKAGLERVKLFTWERCAEQTVEVYRRVLEGAR